MSVSRCLRRAQLVPQLSTYNHHLRKDYPGGRAAGKTSFRWPPCCRIREGPLISEVDFAHATRRFHFAQQSRLCLDIPQKVLDPGFVCPSCPLPKLVPRNPAPAVRPNSVAWRYQPKVVQLVGCVVECVSAHTDLSSHRASDTSPGSCSDRAADMIHTKKQHKSIDFGVDVR
jgi:hypothetical protein